MRSARSARATRGVIAATFATLVALISHVAGGGAVPGPIGVIAPLILSITICVMLAGTRLSLVRLSISVAVSQVLFHTLFVLGTTSAAPAAGHTHSVVIDPTAVAHGMHVGPTMWIGHTIAALITIAALYHAEVVARAILGLRTRLQLWWRTVTRPATVVIPRLRVRIEAHVASLPVGYFADSAPLRGPPSLHAV